MTEASTVAGPVDQNAVHAAQPQVFVVSACPFVGKGWDIRGIFSLQGEASAMLAALETDPSYIQSSSVVERMTMEQIKRQLVFEQLGEFAKSIDNWMVSQPRLVG